MIWGSGGSKSNLAKVAGAEPAGQMRDEKLHTDVARSRFPRQNAESTTCSDHFWKLRCWKSARRSGAKHISKSKVLKTDGLGPLLEVEMSKKRTPLWRKSKCTKHNMFGPLVDVQMLFCVASAWDSAHCQKWAKREGIVAVSTTTITTLHYTSTTTTSTTAAASQLHHNYNHNRNHNYTNYIILHYTTFNYFTLHYANNHNYNYTMLRCTELHKLHYTTLHSTSLH